MVDFHGPDGFVSASHLEAHHPPEILHLPDGDLEPGVTRQTGVVHACDLRVSLEELGDLLGAAAVRVHPKAERLHPAEREVAVHRTRDRTGRVHEERESFDQLRIVRDEGAADQVGVPAQVLRHRVEHDVGAQFQRSLQVRGRERVVHDASRTRPVREISEGGDVDHLQEGVRGGFDPHERGVLPKDGTACDEVRHVDRVELEPPLIQHAGEQPVRPAVHVVRDRDVIAGLQREQQRRRRAEPARETQRPRPSLERREDLLERLARGVARPRVVPRFRLAHRGLGVRRGLVDRDVHGAELGLGVLPDVDRAGLEPHLPLVVARRHLAFVPFVPARPAHRISGGIAQPRRFSSSTASCPERASVHSADLRLASWPGANSRGGERRAGRVAAAARREPGEGGLTPVGPRGLAAAIGASGQRGRWHHDLALLRIAGRAEPPLERVQAGERGERRVDLVDRSQPRAVHAALAQHGPAPGVRARAARRQASGEHDRARVREHFDRRALHRPSTVPGEGLVDRSERGEPDRHPLVERVLGHPCVRRRVEALDAEPSELALGETGPARVRPSGRRVDRDDVGSEVGDQLAEIADDHAANRVDDRAVGVQQDEVEPLANPDVDPERSHVRRGNDARGTRGGRCG